MCGRFNILTDVETLMSTFEILRDDITFEEYTPQYNISPSPRNTPINTENFENLSYIPIIVSSQSGRRAMQSALWPLVPSWAGDTVPKYSTANARSETMAELASFRNSWRRSQRCLIPASGFYEWQKLPEQQHKQPWHIHHKDQRLMSFAGLWETGKSMEGQPFVSCAIITTQANQLMSEIHNTNQRMPVIIEPEDRDIWLTGTASEAVSLATTYRDGSLTANPISTKINNPRYTKSDCIEPVEQASVQ